MNPPDRYGSDVLAAGWQKPKRPVSRPVVLGPGLVVEDATSGFCGAAVRWENGLVVLEDRRGKRRSFPVGGGFLIDGSPVTLTVPPRTREQPTRSTSGSRVDQQPQRAKVALPSRIFVEGRHDAELVEKIWGDDLRHVGVVVEFLGGIDDLPAIVADFAPGPGRRLGVIADHLVAGSKETRIAQQVAHGPHGRHVLVVGHSFIDIWQAIKPARLNIAAWPQIPRGTDWKSGTCAALGWPHADQADIARVWQHLLGRVRDWNDLERELLTSVETVIDFVTADQPLS